MERPEDKTILVVDDEPDVRGYLKMILEDAGFRVLTAGDGVEALELIREDRPDFISLDQDQPDRGHREQRPGCHLLICRKGLVRCQDQVIE